MCSILAIKTESLSHCKGTRCTAFLATAARMYYEMLLFSKIVCQVMKLAFVFNPHCPAFSAAGKALIARYGDVPVAEADAVVALGGDGTLFHTLPRAQGKLVYGYVPADSNSRGFLMHRHAPGDDLIGAIERSDKMPLHPLVGWLSSTDGTAREIMAFNEIIVEHDSAQAVLVNVRGLFNKLSGAQQVIVHKRIMGDGLIFSSLLGATGSAKFHGAPQVIAPVRNVMIALGKCICDPEGGIAPVIGELGSVCEVELMAGAKRRAVRIDYDSWTLRPAAGHDFDRLTVRLADTPYATLARKPGADMPLPR